MIPSCRVCGIELNDENWRPSLRKRNRRVCKKCNNKYDRSWRKANPERARENSRRRCARQRRKQGMLPFNENRECALFLGIHVAERVLGHVFKDVEQMPNGNPGYDFICNHGKKIDVKSSCIVTHTVNGTEYQSWHFNIRRNPIADFFLCVAFDNRDDLNPMYTWLIPGSVVNHLMATDISPGTIHKWDEYQLDISKIVLCCEAMR